MSDRSIKEEKSDVEQPALPHLLSETVSIDAAVEKRTM